MLAQRFLIEAFRSTKALLIKTHVLVRMTENVCCSTNDRSKTATQKAALLNGC